MGTDLNGVLKAAGEASKTAEIAMEKARQQVVEGLGLLQQDLDKMYEMVARNRIRAFSSCEQEIKKAGVHFSNPVKRSWQAGQDKSKSIQGVADDVSTAVPDHE